MKPDWPLEATTIADGVRSGRFRAAEIVELMLDTYTRLNASLNAIVYLKPNDSLSDEAASIDRLVRQGRDPGPLAGVPIAVKDLEDVAGLPTTYGSNLDARTPDRDSIQVDRFRRAGAIIVGKTNAPEFGYSFETKNPRYGQTRNPRDLSLTPGGSSGGSAAAVAAGIVPIATASDGGGSIRIPAAFCGLPGLKSTHGLIPLADDLWGSLDHTGCLTANLRDLARCLDVVADVPPRSVRKGFESGLAEPLPFSDLRAVVALQLCGAMLDETVAQPFTAAIEKLQLAGMTIVPLQPPLPEVLEPFLDIASKFDYERWLTLSDADREKLSHGYTKWCKRGGSVTDQQFARARAIQAELRAKVEALLAHADVLICPTVGMLPWRIGELDRDPMRYLMTYPTNLTGHPSLTVPIPGLLAGVQLVGRDFSERFLLRLGQAMTTALSVAPTA